MSGDDHRIRTERVSYGGRSFRICSQTRPDRAEIATTLELGETLLMSKAAPYNATLEGDVIDQALDSENRIVRERLMAGDLDAWLDSPSHSAAEPIAPVSSPSSVPPRRKPGRWAVKVGMVENPFQHTEKPASPAAADGGQKTGREQALTSAAVPPAAESREAVPEPIPSTSRPRDAATTEPDLPAGPGSRARKAGATAAPDNAATDPDLPARPAPPASAPPRVGSAAPLRTMGPYRIVEDVGPGRYLAVAGSGDSERLVALRVVDAADPSLHNEARALLRIEHAGLVPVLEAGIHGNALFCALPLVPGHDGQAILSRSAEVGRPLAVDAVAWIVKEVARTLEVLHAAGRAHGAVGPRNVIVGWGGEVRLDGLADMLGKAGDQAERPAQTDDVAALGSLLYALLGRASADESSPVRAKFVPPALLQIAGRARREPGAKDPFRSVHAVSAALAAYLAHDAPRTDADRLARVLGELFPDGEREEAARRQALLQLARSVPPATRGTPVLEDDEHPSDAERASGTVVDGRYRIKRLCGRGGMGWVYEAEHEGIGRRVALKILHPLYSRSPDIAERFRREARAATKIGHPHIVDVFDFGTTDDGCLYIAMEFLEGRDLGHLLDAEENLPVQQALRITVQICRALEAAHAVGIVHRDLKPENIFLCDRADGTDFVKVLDFGIAKHLADAPAQKLTRPNIALGTPEYMAPEQIDGRSEPRSDLYAVGTMLYEMLCGTPPFEGTNYLDVFRRKAVENPSPPSDKREGIPPALDEIVLRSLARKPDGRQASMDALAAEIETLARGL